MQKTNEQLAVGAQNGNIQDRHDLINRNMGLLATIANRYNGYACTREDLVQAAVVGALEAIATYDATRATKWTTHVYWLARKEVALLCIPDRVGKSSKARKVFWKYSRAYNQLLNELNEEPTDQQMADRIGVSLKTYIKARDLIEMPEVSLDAHNPETNCSLHEVIGTTGEGEFYQTEAMDTVWIRQLADRFLESLDDQDALVWNERLDCAGRPTPAQTIANFLGVSRQAVMNWEEKLKERFKKFVKRNS